MASPKPPQFPGNQRDSWHESSSDCRQNCAQGGFDPLVAGGFPLSARWESPAWERAAVQSDHQLPFFSSAAAPDQDSASP